MASDQTIKGLTKELNRLRAEQDNAMDLAIYVGMTKEQARVYEERQRRIYRLIDKIEGLRVRSKI